jgi:outer membrane protein assembly factor BamB
VASLCGALQAQHLPRRADRVPREVWHVDGRGHGRPAVGSGIVYFLSARHEVRAFDAQTGGALWTADTGEPGAATSGSAVVLSGDAVVAGDYNLVAFDRRTGAFRWRFVPAIGYAPGIYVGGATSDVVLAGSAEGRLYAVWSATGELKWNAVVSADPLTTVFAPVTDGTVIAAGYTTFHAPNAGGVVLLDLASGRELWRAEFPKAPDPLLGTGSAGGPVIAGNVICASSGDGTIYMFDRRDGSVRWSIPGIPGLPGILRGPLSPPQESAHGADYRPLALSGSTLIAGSLKGPVVAYDLRTRRRRWRYVDEGGGSVAFGISADEEAVYVPFYSGRQVALDLESGRERWRTADPRAGFLWRAVSDSRRVYLAGGNGGYVAFER